MPPNTCRRVGGDIDDTQKDKFLDETTWNLCAPVRGTPAPVLGGNIFWLTRRCPDPALTEFGI